VRKGKIAHGISLGFQAQIEDLHLKGCIPEENAKNTLTGRNIAPNPPQNPIRGWRLHRGLIKIFSEN
jgi:hypothetical protein